MLLTISEDNKIDQQHHMYRKVGNCCVRLHFLIIPNREVESIVLDSLLDAFDKRMKSTTAAHEM